MKLDTLEDLFVQQLRELYDAENRIIKALPKLARAAQLPGLQRAFQEHLEQTQEHVRRLEQVFERLGLKRRGMKCDAIKGLLNEGKALLREDAKPPVLDAGLIAAAQKVEHFEIAGYGCARTWARLLGHDQAVGLLQQTLDEEGATDHKLTELAERIINPEAVHA
jgi:ferritin-like metal-binding protein YciE